MEANPSFDIDEFREQAAASVHAASALVVDPSHFVRNDQRSAATLG